MTVGITTSVMNFSHCSRDSQTSKIRNPSPANPAVWTMSPAGSVAFAMIAL
jgi:hypothetical protein